VVSLFCVQWVKVRGDCRFVDIGLVELLSIKVSFHNMLKLQITKMIFFINFSQLEIIMSYSVTVMEMHSYSQWYFSYFYW
jgi:hypothetical protein